MCSSKLIVAQEWARSRKTLAAKRALHLGFGVAAQEALGDHGANLPVSQTRQAAENAASLLRRTV
jgi:hypothetical protein